MSGHGTRQQGAGANASAPLPSDPFNRPDPPAFEATLSPHRSLSLGGARAVIVLLALGFAVPLIPLLGTAAAWGLLPFLVAAIYGIYAAFRRSYADGLLREDVRIWADLMTVVRTEPRGGILRWHANPFWVRMTLHEDARIEKYLTLKGNGREIELGAFLSPQERERLFEEIDRALGGLHHRPTPG